MAGTYMTCARVTAATSVVLWIGGEDARFDGNMHLAEGVKTVIGLQQQGERDFWMRTPPAVAREHRYGVADTEQTDISPVLAETAWLIEHAPGPVLVHCTMGMSRSAAVVVHYLWAIEGVGDTPADALAVLRRAWKRADPNPGFMRQIAAMPRRQAPRPGVS